MILGLGGAVLSSRMGWGGCGDGWKGEWGGEEKGIE